MFAFRPRRTLHSMLYYYYYYYKIEHLSRATDRDSPIGGVWPAQTDRPVDETSLRRDGGQFPAIEFFGGGGGGCRCVFPVSDALYCCFVRPIIVIMNWRVGFVSPSPSPLPPLPPPGAYFRALLSCLAGSHTINECRKWRRRSDPSRVKSYRSHTAQYYIIYHSHSLYIHLYIIYM